MSNIKPDIRVDFSDGAVDIATAAGRAFRIEVVNGHTLRVWAPNGDALALVPRSSNVIEVATLTRLEQRSIGLG